MTKILALFALGFLLFSLRIENAPRFRQPGQPTNCEVDLRAVICTVEYEEDPLFFVQDMISITVMGNLKAPHFEKLKTLTTTYIRLINDDCGTLLNCW